MNEVFRKIASKLSQIVGTAKAFFVALIIILVWFLTGPIFGYSDTWQLIINTGTTIITFLMVFIIQNTQNRDAKATHLKLDELIKAIRSANNELVDVENVSDTELEKLGDKYKRFRNQEKKRNKNE